MVNLDSVHFGLFYTVISSH